MNANLKCVYHLNTCVVIALINLLKKDSAGNISTYDIIVKNNWKFRKPMNVDEIFMMLNGDIGDSVGKCSSMQLIFNAHDYTCDAIGLIDI